MSCVPVKTKGGVRFVEDKSEIPGRQRAEITVSPGRRRKLPDADLVTDADLRKSRARQAGHPVDVG